MTLTGKIIDWSERLVRAVDDPEAEVAGGVEPGYAVSEVVSVSRDGEMFVYHVPAGSLGQGASFGNDACWAQTRGGGTLQSLFSVRAGIQIMGGMALSYLLPFTDLATAAAASHACDTAGASSFARVPTTSEGMVHLHPAYQQREATIGDGLEVIETLYLPRLRGEDERGGEVGDPPAACVTAALRNHTPHPLRVTLIASVALRGHTDPDLRADYDDKLHTLLAHNASKPEYVRFFTSDHTPDHYWAAADEEEVYFPTRPLPDCTDEEGDLTAALQFDLTLLPGQQRVVRLFVGFSLKGREEARRLAKVLRKSGGLLKETVKHAAESVYSAGLDAPEDVLTQGVQWAKACMVRSLANYELGTLFTNDPGKSTKLVGRDAAWFVHGCDFVRPEISRELLDTLMRYQRDDGLIPEWIDGNSGEWEDHGFNINDNTPLFVCAAVHHVQATGDADAGRALLPGIAKACDLIMSQTRDRGLVWCDADGFGARGICGWRNIMEHDRISGAVTEVNAECYAALRGAADLAHWLNEPGGRAERWDAAADDLRKAINRELIDTRTGLYALNIDLHGQVCTRTTVDQVFPLIFGVADEDQTEAITTRLFDTDFMTRAGVRVLPDRSPRFDPEGKAGLSGGVWPGATWWLSMGCRLDRPRFMADALGKSYSHLLKDPCTYNTMPGQFNEWLDGRTLVNCGMRLSPWAPPRFLWAAIEGLAGICLDFDRVRLDPSLPPEWNWLSITDLPCHGKRLTLVLTRGTDGLCVHTCDDIDTELPVERYEELVEDSLEIIASGLSSTAFRRGSETLLFVGNRRDRMMSGPLLAHHLLDSGRRYRVSTATSGRREWRALGELDGERLQRLAVRVEPRGYVMYRFDAA